MRQIHDIDEGLPTSSRPAPALRESARATKVSSATDKGAVASPPMRNHMRNLVLTAATSLAVSMILSACAPSTTQGPAASNAAAPTAAAAGPAGAAQSPSPSVDKADGGW
jgi:hypothetical protein